MSDSITLHEILSQYRKSDLVEIAKLHHLHGYSQYKKAQMVEFLCRALLDADVMRKYFMYLSEAELELLDSGESQVWIDQTNISMIIWRKAPISESVMTGMEELFVCRKRCGRHI